jgi:hypothetical protein
MPGLPFSRTQFLDVFEAYNRALLVPAIALWAFAIVVVVSLVRGRAISRAAFSLLALLWAWSGGVYHVLFFSRINPAARLFAALFVIQALLFARLALSRTNPRVEWRRDARHSIALLLAAYALAYPFLAAADGDSYPRSPTFGVPCPTTILTAGLLLATDPLPRSLTLIPLLWCAIGGSAAILLGMSVDVAMFLAGALLATYAFLPHRWRPRFA